MSRVPPRLMLVLLAAVLAACATTAPEDLRPVYSDDGYSELRLPPDWASRADLGRAATLRVADGVADSYLVVHTYLADEVDDEALADFARRVSESMRAQMRAGRLTGPRTLAIGGQAAVEYEVTGYLGDTGIAYLSTVVEGRRARFHHLIAWTTAERYAANREALRAIAATFRESPQPRAPKTRIDLTFDWPQRLEARTDYYSRKSRGADAFELRASGRMTVRAHGADQLLVSSRVSRHRMTPEVRDPGKAEYLQRLLAEAMTGLPDYVITAEGEFVRVENLEGYHRRIEQALLEGLPDGSGDARTRARELVRSMLSPEVLSASLEDEWNGVVGAWAGGSYVPGETYAFTTLYRAPALGGETFPMSVTQRLSGRLPCHARASVRDCVRLVLTSRVAGPAFTRATDRVVSRTVGGAEVTDVEIVKETVVVTDPKTLLPYQVRSTETKSIAVRAGGKTHTSREVQESRTLYTYPG